MIRAYVCCKRGALATSGVCAIPFRYHQGDPEELRRLKCTNYGDICAVTAPNSASLMFPEGLGHADRQADTELEQKAMDLVACLDPVAHQRFAHATSLPLIQVEGGWSSAVSPWGGGTPIDQAKYFARIGSLLAGVGAKLWVMLFYNDLNLADPSWNLPPDRQAVLQNFATMGITNTALAPKPAYWDWKRLFERPLLP